MARHSDTLRHNVPSQRRATGMARSSTAHHAPPPALGSWTKPLRGESFDVEPDSKWYLTPSSEGLFDNE